MLGTIEPHHFKRLVRGPIARSKDSDGFFVTATSVDLKVTAACSRCRACIGACPVAAITDSGRRVAIDRQLCLNCYHCLAVCRRRLRGLVRFIETGKRHIVYTDFEDTLGDHKPIELPLVTAGINSARFRAKARAFLQEHDNNPSLRRLKGNLQLSSKDLAELEQLLLTSGAGGPDELKHAEQTAQGLGLFIRSLVGLDRAAATDAFSRFLAGTTYTATQIEFINLIVTELTANGVMDPGRLYESAFTDKAPQGPDLVFADEDLDVIIETLHQVRDRAVPIRA